MTKTLVRNSEIQSEDLEFQSEKPISVQQVGHVVSLSGCGQKEHICSYKYYSLSGDNPFVKSALVTYVEMDSALVTYVEMYLIIL